MNHNEATLSEAAAAAGTERPLTILQVLPQLNSGGVERGTLEIAEAIVAAGGRALVASAGGRLESKLERLGGEHFRMPLQTKNPLRLRANARRLEALIQAEGVDLIHARSRAPAWSAYWAAQRLGLPFVTTYHGVYNENLPLKRRYNAVMAKGDRVIAIARFIGDLIQSRHGVAAEKIRVIHRGADISQFSEHAVAPARIAMLADAWGLGDDPRPVLMLPGRLTRWKGQTLFLDALALLKKRRGGADFLGLMVGGEKGAGARTGGKPGKGPGGAPAEMGRFEKELRARMATLGIEDCVRITGHCDDMPAALRLAHAVVSASLEPEAFGRVAVEAQAMGLPIIASAHGGAAETVADGVTGFLFEPGSAEALADALSYALDLPADRRRSMGAAGVDRVRARFSIAAMQADTLRVYEQLLGRSFTEPGRPIDRDA